MLEVDPKRRYTIVEIQEHPWYKAADKEIPSLGIKVGSQVIKADPLVLNELNKLGFDTKHAKSSIEVNKHGPDLAAYYLQLKKMRREGYESEYDIHSASFKYAVADRDQNSF